MQKLGALRTTWIEPERTPRTPGIETRRYAKFRTALRNRRKTEAASEDRNLCVDCACEGKPYDTTPCQGHHILPRSERMDLLYEPENIEFVCAKHHGLRNHLESVATIAGRYVVYGKPGAGKTTYVAAHASPGALVWDADVLAAQHGYGRWPWTEQQLEVLDRGRTQWLRRAKQHRGQVWCIVRWPSVAFALAVELRAKYIRVIKSTHQHDYEMMAPSV